MDRAYLNAPSGKLGKKSHRFKTLIGRHDTGPRGPAAMEYLGAYRRGYSRHASGRAVPPFRIGRMTGITDDL